MEHYDDLPLPHPSHSLPLPVCPRVSGTISMGIGPNLGTFRAPPSPAVGEPHPSPTTTATLVMSQAGGEELRVICPQVLLRAGG